MTLRDAREISVQLAIEEILRRAVVDDLELPRDVRVPILDDDAARQEERDAKALGMKFVHAPFYGVFGQSDAFYEKIVGELKKGGVYVHCLHGRDRTSLVVALYRVLVEEW